MYQHKSKHINATKNSTKYEMIQTSIKLQHQLCSVGIGGGGGGVGAYCIACLSVGVDSACPGLIGGGGGGGGVEERCRFEGEGLRFPSSLFGSSSRFRFKDDPGVSVSSPSPGVSLPPSSSDIFTSTPSSLSPFAVSPVSLPSLPAFFFSCSRCLTTAFSKYSLQ